MFLHKCECRPSLPVFDGEGPRNDRCSKNTKALLKATKNNDLEKVIELCNNADADVSYMNYRHLRSAAINGYLEIVKFLCTKAPINAINEAGYWAIYYNKLDVLKYILSLPNIKVTEDMITGAVEADNLVMLKYLISLTENKDHTKALMESITRMRINAFKYLLSVFTPSIEVLNECLIRKTQGIDATEDVLCMLELICSYKGLNFDEAFKIAYRHGYLAKLKIICIYMPDKELINKAALDASATNRLEILQYLISISNEVNLTSATINASSKGLIENVKYLLSLCSDKDKQYTINRCLVTSVSEGHLELTKYLFPLSEVNNRAIDRLINLSQEKNHLSILEYLKSVVG